jgi:hypothetical protein
MLIKKQKVKLEKFFSCKYGVRRSAFLAKSGFTLPLRFLIYLITYIFFKLPNPGFRTKSLIKEKGKQFSLKLQYSTFSKEAHV